VFIGDTETDVLAGLLGAVAVIGYANNPGKAETLSRTGARAVVTDLAGCAMCGRRAWGGGWVPRSKRGRPD
jgi:beta-phosphoglucomutase-like phosphatase (HAD superfamily)